MVDHHVAVSARAQRANEKVGTQKVCEKQRHCLSPFLAQITTHQLHAARKRSTRHPDAQSTMIISTSGSGSTSSSSSSVSSSCSTTARTKSSSSSCTNIQQQRQQEEPPCLAYRSSETTHDAIERSPSPPKVLTLRTRPNDTLLNLLKSTSPPPPPPPLEPLDFVDISPVILDDGTSSAVPLTTHTPTLDSYDAESTSLCIGGKDSAPDPVRPWAPHIKSEPTTISESSAASRIATASADSASTFDVMEYPESPEHCTEAMGSKSPAPLEASSSSSSSSLPSTQYQLRIEKSLDHSMGDIIGQSSSKPSDMNSNTPSTSFPTSATTITDVTTTIAHPLVSALRRRSMGDATPHRSHPAVLSMGRHKTRPATGRRVGGLWNPIVVANDALASSISHSHHMELLVERNALDVLQDTTLEQVFSFLSMADVLKCTMVDRRCSYIAQRDTIWKRVDATDFCQQAHATFCKKHSNDSSSFSSSLAHAKATKSTSEALDQVLQKYVFASSVTTSLTIRSIGKHLSAEWFLPGSSSLQELTLSGFDDLTDTHVHVMLLTQGYHHFHHHQGGVMAAAACKSNAVNKLRKLVLEDCPLLTNASVRSIATRCTNLEELSLEGSGSSYQTKTPPSAPQLTDVTPLAELLATSPALLALATATIMTNNSNSSSSGIPSSCKFILGKRCSTSSSSGLASLSSLFGPAPSKVAAAPATMSRPNCTKPQPKSNPSTSPLASFFGPPPAKIAAAPALSLSPAFVNVKPQLQQPRPAAPMNSLSSLFVDPPPKFTTTSVQPTPNVQPSQPQQAKANSLSSLFGGPPPSSKHSMTFSSQAGPHPHQPPQPHAQAQGPPTNTLASLFAVPGSSPQRTKPPVPLSARHARGTGKLVRLDFRGTTITAQAFMACLQQASAASSTRSIHSNHNNSYNRHVIHLESLRMNGSSWSDETLRQLANLMQLDHLQELDLEVPPTTNSAGNQARTSPVSTKLTHVGLGGLLASTTTTMTMATDGSSSSTTKPCLSQLQRLNLKGHTQITEAGVVATFLKAAPCLDTIVL
jgi:hypothetical protein